MEYIADFLQVKNLPESFAYLQILEQFFQVKNGELHFTIVKGLDGSKKVGGFGIGRMKLWVSKPSYEEMAMIKTLSNMKEETDASMMQIFGIKQFIKNGTSTFIGSRGW